MWHYIGCKLTERFSFGNINLLDWWEGSWFKPWFTPLLQYIEYVQMFIFGVTYLLHKLFNNIISNCYSAISRDDLFDINGIHILYYYKGIYIRYSTSDHFVCYNCPLMLSITHSFFNSYHSSHSKVSSSFLRNKRKNMEETRFLALSLKK